MADNATPLPEETRPRDRQELYDRIRQTSKEKFILDDMIRLGFWPKNENAPSVPEQIINRELELGNEIRAILTEQRRIENPEKLLKEMRKQRMAESKKKREETKQRRELERKERAERWKQRKEGEILYVGSGFSGGMNHINSDVPKLTAAGLPVFQDAASLAKAMDLSVNELRFLSFCRGVSKTNHYRRFYIAKKTGGQRLISAPMPRLKKAQYWILNSIFSKAKTHASAHGFLAQRSIVSNALPHVGAEVVINLDLKDFFPTITYPRVKGVFQKMGYSESVATLLALLCTEPDIDEAQLDGETWYVCSGERFLPQGAPTSPAITNVLCHRLDCRLQGLAQKLGFTYTRYADDLTFSASGEGVKNVNKLKGLVYQIVQNEGFQVHPEKDKVMRKGSRKEVTGIVVNDKPGVDRKTLRQFRALLHQIEKTGIAGKTWGKGSDLLSSIEGYANYVTMVDAAKGKVLKEKVKKIQAMHGLSKPPRKTYPKGKYSLQPIAKATVAPPATTSTETPAETKDSGIKSLLNKFWKK
jgi:retron-type reverse transcriptase